MIRTVYKNLKLELNRDNINLLLDNEIKLTIDVTFNQELIFDSILDTLKKNIKNYNSFKMLLSSDYNSVTEQNINGDDYLLTIFSSDYKLQIIVLSSAINVL